MSFKAAINYIEISSLICKIIFNEHNFQYNLLYAKFTDIKNWLSRPGRLESNFSPHVDYYTWHRDHDLRWNRPQMVRIEFKSGPTYVKHTIGRENLGFDRKLSGNSETDFAWEPCKGMSLH